MDCQHPNWTRPQTIPIHANQSQEIIGEFMHQVCLDCGWVRGEFTHGSTFSPTKLPVSAKTWELAIELIKLAVLMP